MKLLSQEQGHIHDPAHPDVERSIDKCRHCNRHIAVNETNSAWVPVQFEPSDFERRETGDYIIPNPDVEDSWLACVWNMSGKGYTPEWRHDRMALSASSFKTMRDAIADRCQGT